MRKFILTMALTTVCASDPYADYCVTSLPGGMTPAPLTNDPSGPWVGGPEPYPRAYAPSIQPHYVNPNIYTAPQDDDY